MAYFWPLWCILWAALLELEAKLAYYLGQCPVLHSPYSLDLILRNLGLAHCLTESYFPGFLRDLLSFLGILLQSCFNLEYVNFLQLLNASLLYQLANGFVRVVVSQGQTQRG